MSKVNKLTDLPSFDSVPDNISKSEVKRNSSIGHQATRLSPTEKQAEFLKKIRDRVDILVTQSQRISQEFSHQASKTKEKSCLEKLMAFFKRIFFDSHKNKFEIPVKPPLSNEEIAKKQDQIATQKAIGSFKDFSDYQTEVMLFSGEVLSAQDEEIEGSKDQWADKLQALKSQLKSVTSRYKASQEMVRIINNQFEDIEVRLGIRQAANPFHETEKLFKRSSQEEETRTLSASLDLKKGQSAFEKPLTLEGIIQFTNELLYLDDDEIIKDGTKIQLKINECRNKIDAERLNPKSNQSEIWVAKANLQNAIERYQMIINEYGHGV